MGSVHWGLNKMADILQTTFPCAFLWLRFKFHWNSLKFVCCKSTIDIKPILVQVMGWCWKGSKPLPEPMMTQLYALVINTLTLWAVWPMTWTRPDALTSEPGGAPGFHSCGGQHKLNRIILRELLPSIDEYNEWSFCAVFTFSSHTSWILGAKTSQKSVHCKVRFTRVFWPNSVQFFCLCSVYVVVGVFRFLYLGKNVHVRHRILNEHKLQLIIFGSILNSSDVFASVTLHQIDVGASFKPTDATASAG